MQKIIDIYQEYKIPPNLQEHMFRVAAVASIICDNFDGILEKKDVVTACLLHDMGNIIKYDMKYFPQFVEPEGEEYWQKVKDGYIKKYGEDEHVATAMIIKELGLSNRIIEFAGQNRFSLLCKHCDVDDMDIKIIHYSDARVSPHGVVSYNERMDEAGKRYKNHKLSTQEEERLKLVACGKEIEKQIFEKCKIRPEDINDDSVKSAIEKLKNFEI